MLRGYTSTNFGQIHYARGGRGKETILLLAPAGRSSRMFLGQSGLLSHLSEHFDIVAPDLLGSGNSDPLPEQATYLSLAQNLVEFMDRLEIESASLFGLHTGNKIGSAMAAHWPHVIDNLLLCGQSHSLIGDQSERNEAMQTIAGRAGTLHGDHMDPLRLRLVEWSMLSQRVLSNWWQPRYLNNLPLAEAIDACARAVLDDIQSDKSIVDLYRMNFEYDMESDWRRIEAPTLVMEVVHPLEDTRYGRQGHKVASIIQNAQVVEISAGGYKMTLEERASELADLIIGFCTRP